MEYLPAGGQDFQAGHRLEQDRQTGCGGQQVFKVVQYEQKLPGLQKLGQRSMGEFGNLLGATGDFHNAQAMGQGRKDQGRVGEGGQRHEVDTSAKSGRRAWAAAMLSRVLPLPGGPVSVSSRVPGSRKRATISATSMSRPTNEVKGAGRFITGD